MATIGFHTCDLSVNQFLADVRTKGFDTVPVHLFYAYCRHLGLDPERDIDLVWIAELCARAPMPIGWTERNDSQDRLFYYNDQERLSKWTHPLEDEHRNLYRRITVLKNRDMDRHDVRLGGLRDELWQLEADVAEAEYAWVDHRDRNGKTFFFNRCDRSSSWIDPLPAIRHRLLLRQRAVWTVLGHAEEVRRDVPNFEVEPGRPVWLEEFTKNHQSNEPWNHPDPVSIDGATGCPVCFEPLCTSRASVLTSVEGRRICKHYFCLACAQRLHSGCPLCRAKSPFGSRCRAVPLPDIEKKPLKWFYMVGMDGDRCLREAEVANALEAMLPFDSELIRRTFASPPRNSKCCASCSYAALLVDAGDRKAFTDVVTFPSETHKGTSLWCHWESVCAKDASRGISLDAFFADGGMLQWIVEHVRGFELAQRRGVSQHIERDSIERWFDALVEHTDGGLSREDLIRALDTCPISVVERLGVSEIRSIIDYVFETRPHHGQRHLSRDQLSKPDGLSEMLLGTVRCSRFGEIISDCGGLPAVPDIANCSHHKAAELTRSRSADKE
eukprot:TRINITY_DN30533_c0_g3_i1.p1 TRINITY_DN30533_c0_g3~~TRINITY_DN30533_c0_g3_i1.p1  ORF type:complete len:556 (+),score=51.85 TRINITY_DN30533_c0_g3_i1:166-1833(+)